MATPHVEAPTGWLAALAIALLGSTGFWGWWTERTKTKSSQQPAQTSSDAALVAALGQFTRDFGDGAGALVEHFRGELKIFSHRCDKLEEKNVQLEAKVDECDARHEDCKHDLATEKEQRAAEIADLKAEIDRLMANPIADY